MLFPGQGSDLSSANLEIGKPVQSENTENKNPGVIIRLVSVVVDVEFESGDLPSIYNALLVKRKQGGDLILEIQPVQQHLPGRLPLARSASRFREVERGAIGARGAKIPIVSVRREGVYVLDPTPDIVPDC